MYIFLKNIRKCIEKTCHQNLSKKNCQHFLSESFHNFILLFFEKLKNVYFFLETTVSKYIDFYFLHKSHNIILDVWRMSMVITVGATVTLYQNMYQYLLICFRWWKYCQFRIDSSIFELLYRIYSFRVFMLLLG